VTLLASLSWTLQINAAITGSNHLEDASFTQIIIHTDDSITRIVCIDRDGKGVSLTERHDERIGMHSILLLGVDISMKGKALAPHFTIDRALHLPLA
jgi:hypothetical protein